MYYQGVRFPQRLIASGNQHFGVVEQTYADGTVRVATIERTLVDILAEPDYGGSWDEIYQSLTRADTDQAHHAGIPTTSVMFPTGTDPASLEPDALLDHWHTGLPQPWAHIQQHLGGGDINTRARGHRHIAAAHQNTDPTLAAHQTLTHTYGATPHTLGAFCESSGGLGSVGVFGLVPGRSGAGSCLR